LFSFSNSSNKNYRIFLPIKMPIFEDPIAFPDSSAMTPPTVRLYAGAIATAKIGTGFFFLINTWLIIDITGRPSSAAITLVMTILPSLLLSPVIGLAVDRAQPARLAYRAELLRWLVLVAYGALCGAGWANEAIGYAVSFCVALGNEIQVLAWRAALTRAVPAERMLRLNALTSVGGQTGQILGAAACWRPSAPSPR
jgi:hypothetical protein